MSLFPALQPAVAAGQKKTELPMAIEAAWDFEADRPIFRGGEPVRVTGIEAVRVWAWNALLTVRRRWPCLSPNYGNDCEALIGTGYSDELKKAEAARYISECLTVSPYIVEASATEISFEGSELTAQVAVRTIYGELTINV